MLVYKDQIGTTLKLAKKPMRIISIVPSQSEFLWHIGLGNELVGITKFCIHPDEMYRGVERVGGTKKLDIKKIRALKPDLIIGNKEENERTDIELLQKEFNVWMSDICTFDDSFDMMTQLGNILGKEKETEKIVADVRTSLTELKDLFSSQTVAYFIWNKPYMLAAKNTFIDFVLNYIGLKNAFSHLERYPEVDEIALQKAQPEFCFLSSEPFPFKQEHVNELKKELPNSKIVIVDGEVFSWYGTRLLHLNAYIKDLKNTLNA